jgi:hypothetical protein
MPHNFNLYMTENRNEKLRTNNRTAALSGHPLQTVLPEKTKSRSNALSQEELYYRRTAEVLKVG